MRPRLMIWLILCPYLGFGCQHFYLCLLFAPKTYDTILAVFGGQVGVYRGVVVTQQGFNRRRGGVYPRRARPPSKELWQETTRAERLGERRGIYVQCRSTSTLVAPEGVLKQMKIMFIYSSLQRNLFLVLRIFVFVFCICGQNRFV